MVLSGMREIRQESAQPVAKGDRRGANRAM